MCGLIVSRAFGADVELVVTVGASHTDNVYLETSPDEIDDLIYRANPRLSVTHVSTNLDASLRYNLEWYKYEDLDISRSYHMGEGSLTGKLFGEDLQVEVGARRMQTLRNSDDVISPGRLPLTDSTIDRDEVYVNPRLSRRIGKSVSLYTSYFLTEGKYRDSGIQGDRNHDAKFELENYAAGRGLTWALRYNGRKTEYELSRDWEYQQASVELGTWVNDSLRVFGSGGKESPWDDPFNADLTDPFWEAGFAYMLRDNLSAEFAAGERSFGSSWRGDIQYTFNRGSTSVRYAETPSTTGFNRSGGRRSVLDPDEFDEFLDTPGSAERYLSKRLNWDLNIEARRTTFRLVLFDEDRSGRIRADGTPLGDEAQRGMRVSLNWQAGNRTSFVISGSLVQREGGSTGDSDYRRAGLGVNYVLGQRTQASLNYAYSEQQPGETNPGGRDYVSNVVSLFLTFTM